MADNRIEITPGVWADARRALWLERERTLAVADVHLGYAWVQRRRGHLLPLAEVEETKLRLQELQADYAPETIVFLGDLVHAAVTLKALEDTLSDVLGALAQSSRLVLTLGNHDRRLPALAERANLPLSCSNNWQAGPHLLLHGEGGEDDELLATRSGAGYLVMGHEHPAVVLGDTLASQARCPCFVAGQDRLILPAFSRWAAGCVVGRQPFLSRLAKTHRWEEAIAILADRLLRVPWSWVTSACSSRTTLFKVRQGSHGSKRRSRQTSRSFLRRTP